VWRAVSQHRAQAGTRWYGLASQEEAKNPSPRPWFSRDGLRARSACVSLDAGRGRQPEERSEAAVAASRHHWVAFRPFRFARPLIRGRDAGLGRVLLMFYLRALGRVSLGRAIKPGDAT